MPTLDLSSLQNIFQYLIAAFGAFLAALWLSLILWTYRDIRSRSDDRFLHILASLSVALLGPLGLIIYLLLRPRYTTDEIYQHTLEEEALLSEIEERSICPGCAARTQPDWQVCPHCHTKLKKACKHCQSLMELSWQICPYCGKPAQGLSREVQPEVDELD